MGTRGLAEYFVIKYAGDEELPSPELASPPEEESLDGDTSLGGFINGEKVKVLKDKLMNAWEMIKKTTSNLPGFIEINNRYKANPNWMEFYKNIKNFKHYIERSDLKKCFGYNTVLLENLNHVRYAISDDPTLDKHEKSNLTNRLIYIQDYIWDGSKTIINIHDLRGLLIRIPEAEEILKQSIVPTWQFGRMGNPSETRTYRVNNNALNNTKKQWENNEKRKKAIEELGDYATEAEIQAHIKKQNKAYRKEIVYKHDEKRKEHGRNMAEARSALGENASSGEIEAYIANKKKMQEEYEKYEKLAWRAIGKISGPEKIQAWIKKRIKDDKSIAAARKALGPRVSNEQIAEWIKNNLQDGVE